MSGGVRFCFQPRQPRDDGGMREGGMNGGQGSQDASDTDASSSSGDGG